MKELEIYGVDEDRVYLAFSYELVKLMGDKIMHKTIPYPMGIYKKYMKKLMEKDQKDARKELEEAILERLKKSL